MTTGESKQQTPVPPEPIRSIPSRGLAALGGLGGKLIDCPEIHPSLVDDGLVYEYIGTNHGIAIYKTIGELRELDAEQYTRP